MWACATSYLNSRIILAASASDSELGAVCGLCNYCATRRTLNLYPLIYWRVGVLSYKMGNFVGIVNSVFLHAYFPYLGASVSPLLLSIPPLVCYAIVYIPYTTPKYLPAKYRQQHQAYRIATYCPYRHRIKRSTSAPVP